MHEVGLMQEAVRMAIEYAAANSATKIHRLRLRVGAMSGVVPEALRFAFDVVCRGTAAEGAVLEIESVPAVCWCRQCQSEFECDSFLNECPRCHQMSTELRRGTELDLASVEVS
ncbi:MAG: hydrogenase maturation nickel metallochaperone HypA [Verrucomicrobiae bacterium]|nr:hydrogenase maturation nickel metallochaperone HypA [Verrucomicrobiae bacterium]